MFTSFQQLSYGYLNGYLTGQIERLQTWREKTLIPTSALVRRALDESLEMHKAGSGHEMTTKTVKIYGLVHPATWVAYLGPKQCSLLQRNIRFNVAAPQVLSQWRPSLAAQIASAKSFTFSLITLGWILSRSVFNRLRKSLSSSMSNRSSSFVVAHFCANAPMW